MYFVLVLRRKQNLQIHKSDFCLAISMAMLMFIREYKKLKNYYNKTGFKTNNNQNWLSQG